MIPKIIHYCWFGGKEKPSSVLKYIKTWQRFLPDYEIKEWNELNFDVNRLLFTHDAYNARKYAFVADVCRLYALLTEGGIYFDTDVEVIKNFDDLLIDSVFIGLENEKVQRVGTSVIGAVPNNEFINRLYSYYQNASFILNDGSYNIKPNTIIISELLHKGNKMDVKVYPADYFSPIDFETKQLQVTDRSYSIHHFSGTWLPKYRRIESVFWEKLGLCDKQIIFRVLRKLGIEH